MNNLSKKLSYRQRALDKLTEDTGVEIEVNEYSDQIFDNKDMDARVATFLSSEPNDRTNAIAEYIFQESASKYRQAKLHGSRSIRHSPLVLRF
jgi:hypothetical protein